MNYKLGPVFGKSQSPENARAVEAMNEEIRKVGGLLHFDVSMDANGWHAECIELDGITTGGTNPNPVDEEIRASIREAIHTAFHITAAAAKEEKPIVNARDAQAVFFRSSNPVLV